jgi:hypothetical protein
MKPQWIDENEYKRLKEAGREACKNARMPQIDKLVEVSAAGQWLWDELGKLGLDDKQKESICFAHGQACFPARDPWETARVILEQSKADRAPVGGFQYGDALLDGSVEGLPPGGMRIVKTSAQLN